MNSIVLLISELYWHLKHYSIETSNGAIIVKKSIIQVEDNEFALEFLFQEEWISEKKLPDSQSASVFELS